MVGSGPLRVCRRRGGARSCRSTEGVAEIPGVPMRLVVDIDRDAARRWIGSVILSGHDVKGAPISGVQAGDTGLHLDLAAAFRGPPGSAVEARLDWRADGALAGELLQGGHRAPLALQRVGAAQLE